MNTSYVPRMKEAVSWVGSSVEPNLPKENQFSARLLLPFCLIEYLNLVFKV